MKKEELNFCKVCGLYHKLFPWGEDGKMPSYDICECCGVEFGYEDYQVSSTKKFRQKWLNSGAKWFHSKEKPDNWNLEEQLKNIPEEYL